MRRLRDRRRSEAEAPVNPMDGLGNLADAMLVLAVGIMLALLLHWKVDISAVNAAAAPEERDEQIAIEESELSEAEERELNEEELQRIGALYYDEENGVFYAVMEDEG